MIDSIKRDLHLVYNTLSTMPMVGDNVDLMAKVKETLRGTFSKVDAIGADKENDTKEGVRHETKKEVKHECPTNR